LLCAKRVENLVVACQTLLGSWIGRFTAGIIVIITLAAGALVMTRLPDAEAQAPKQQPPAQKQQPQQQPQAPKPAQIDRNGVLILIRETLLALDQANKTGNYTVLCDLGSPDFQANTAARLAEIFAQQRRDNVDLSGVAVIEPQLTLLPQIEANGMMRMAGFFPSVPTQVNFELARQAAPAAPQSPAPAAPQAAAPAAPKPNPPERPAAPKQ
jgi:hypothetical protein